MAHEHNVPPDNRIAGTAHYIGKGAMVDAQVASRAEYFKALLACLTQTVVTTESEKRLSVEAGLKRALETMRKAHAKGGKVIFIGNGGSAAIASHMAVDYTKNGGIRAISFSDAPTLTCLANDFGYDRVFSKQLEYYARKDDVVVIVSTSGRSLNIVAAAEQAFAMGLAGIITFSGMNPNNVLRRKGRLNFYVPCPEYGLVELSHLALLHSLVSVP